MVNDDIIKRFYTAFQQKDFTVMQSLYHTEAEFYDPVFENLNSKQVKEMWRMLLTNATDLHITFSEVVSAEHKGSCRWEAAYTFTQTNRAVHNIVKSTFEFKEGKIYRQHDAFNLWRWSTQALGPVGLLLGWSPLIKNKIRNMAQGRLKKFMTAL